MVRLWNTVAQSPCLNAYREVLSTNCCGNAVPYPYTVWEEGMHVLWVEVLAYGTRNRATCM